MLSGWLVAVQGYPSHMNKCHYMKETGPSGFSLLLLPLTAVKIHISTTEAEESGGGYKRRSLGEGWVERVCSLEGNLSSPWGNIGRVSVKSRLASSAVGWLNFLRQVTKEAGVCVHAEVVNVIDRGNGHYMGQVRIARPSFYHLYMDLWWVRPYCQGSGCVGELKRYLHVRKMSVWVSLFHVRPFACLINVMIQCLQR